MDIEAWLNRHGLGDFAPQFKHHAVSVEDLPELTIGDLREMGLPIGPRRRFLRALREQADRGSSTSEERSAERRQMTVMFADLVGSTDLSVQLDPEDLRNLMVSYQELVTEIIENHGGHVAKYLGDGTLAYFGWPIASEDQAGLSVAAGLEIVRQVPELSEHRPGGGRLSSRVGIATGAVVIGDISGERDAIVGQTPNLAARLQGTAPPGGVACDEATASLVEPDFELSPGRSARLKGIADPVEVRTVVRPKERLERFGSHSRGSYASPLLGRERQLELLRRRWHAAILGKGSVVLVAGEAGIGKSRLILELIGEVAGQEVTRLQCSPPHASSVLYPVRQTLGRRLGSPRDADDARGRLTSFVREWAPNPEPAFALLADLLNIGNANDMTVAPSDTTERRIALLETLKIWLTTSDRPSLIVVEDLHWIDPTTLDLLALVAESVSTSSLMILGSHRPGWEGDSRLESTTISLSSLPGHLIADLARSVAPALSAEIVDRIVDRSDGNALYAAELARAMGGKSGGPIPETLSAGLSAQLDRLGAAKAVAQTAAVIGREFSLDLIGRVLGDDKRALMDQFVASSLVEPSEEPDEMSFRHALVRDAAYESLLFSDRRRLHLEVAELLESDGIGETQPEVVARHFSEGEAWGRALPNWRRAGRRALQIGASPEATSHLRSALDALEQLPPDEERDRIEIDILLELAPAAMTVRGYASETPKTLYQRAVELATKIDDHDLRFTALWGGYYITEIRAQWKESEANLTELATLDRGSLRPDLPIQIDHALSTWATSTGRFEIARMHAARIVEQYDRELHERHKYLFGGHDPGVCGHGQLGTLHWSAGLPDDAVAAVADGEVLAAQLGHPPSEALIRFHACVMRINSGDRAAARVAVDGLSAYCREHGIGAMLRTASLWEAMLAEDRRAGYDALRPMVDGMRESGRLGFLVPSIANGCADTAIAVGKLDHALVTLEYAQWAAETTGELAHIGTTHRLRGKTLSLMGERDRALAEWEAGLEWADTTGNRWVALETAHDLAELHILRGDGDRARRIIQAALAGISGGEGTPAVRQATNLLATTG